MADVPTAANGQAAAQVRQRGDDGMYYVHTVQIFTATPVGISHNVVFQIPELFGRFGLPCGHHEAGAFSDASASPLSYSGERGGYECPTSAHGVE